MSDAALVDGLRARQPVAIRVFYERYSRRVARVLHRLLGGGDELEDAQHEVFERAIRSIERLRDPAALEAWLTSVAVFTARSIIQRRVRRRWLRFVAPEELPEVEAVAASSEIGEALRATYAVLERIDTDDRIAFVLRFIEGMKLEEGAEACRVSLATFKRRLARAEDSFVEQARDNAVLAEWLEGGSRWGKQNAL